MAGRDGAIYPPRRVAERRAGIYNTGVPAEDPTHLVPRRADGGDRWLYRALPVRTDGGRPMKKAPEDEMVQPPGAAETPWSTAARPAAGPSTATREGGLKWPLPFAVMACLVPLGYAAYTGHIWEDYFITFRYSQNLVEGQGLVYNPGERVHGFT